MATSLAPSPMASMRECTPCTRRRAPRTGASSARASRCAPVAGRAACRTGAWLTRLALSARGAHQQLGSGVPRRAVSTGRRAGRGQAGAGGAGRACRRRALCRAIMRTIAAFCAGDARQTTTPAHSAASSASAPSPGVPSTRPSVRPSTTISARAPCARARPWGGRACKLSGPSPEHRPRRRTTARRACMPMRSRSYTFFTTC